MSRPSIRVPSLIPSLVVGLAMVLALPGCEDLTGLAGNGATDRTTTRLVERDIEAPEVYQATEQGLWDGRPSLGGVWVAATDVTDPERVIIRNEANGSFVIGALFRRERNNPGPAFQVSSDAADALGMLAGQPANLNVTALRREEIASEPAATPTPVEGGAIDGEDISTETLESTAADAIAAADAARATSPSGASANTAAAAQTPAPTSNPAATPAAASGGTASAALEKSFVQIGIFSVEANARATADRLRSVGLIPTVRAQTSRNKPFWRVIVGPATTRSDRDAILRSAKDLGFNDAYFVTN